MPSNVEIKARVAELGAVRAAALALGATPPEALAQEDVFYRVPRGRLKLRILAPARGELILYHRADREGPKRSDYRIAPTADPAALRAILDEALPAAGVVRKRRELLLLGQTRLHLDRVEGLGDFVELEVVLRPGQSGEEGERVAHELMEALGIDPAGLVAAAYVDLLREAAHGDR